MSESHVVVSGGTAGINLAIAEAFAGRGDKVTVFSRTADKVQAAVAALGAGAFGETCDVRDFAAVQQLLTRAHQRFGDIDVLVCGAAGNFPAPAAALSPNGFKAVVDIDLLGTFNVCRAAHPFLRRPGACVINLSAQQAWQAVAFQVHACAAKAGVDQLTRVLAVEWGPEGIRVNAISPGATAGTGGMDRLAPKGELPPDAIAQAIPLGRIGTKADVASLALFLSSQAASYITGAIIPVDGGMSLNGAGLFSQVLQRTLAEGPRS